MSGIDVFVGNYPVIDWELYTLWVEGEGWNSGAFLLTTAYSKLVSNIKHSLAKIKTVFFAETNF